MKLKFKSQARESLYSGIKKLYRAVSSTLGPHGNTVVLESNRHIGGMTVTKDGVTVARTVVLKDNVENLGATMVKQAALKTASKAGDGTTTSIVLAESIVGEGFNAVEGDSSLNRTKIVNYIKQFKDIIIDKINRFKVDVNDNIIKNIATISTNNNDWLGSLVYDAYKFVGEYGHVTVDNSKTSETYFEGANGIKIDKGMQSRAFINTPSKDQCILEGSVSVLVSTVEITDTEQIRNALEPVIRARKPLIIVAPCSDQFVMTMALNVRKNGLKLLVVQPPNFGWKQEELMEDIAIATGATYFSEKTGDNLGNISFEDLGNVSRVVSDQESTVLVRDESSDIEVGGRIDELKISLAEEGLSEADRNFLQKRVATLGGGIGVIYAGGNSDIEQKELYDRIDDAVCAVRSAIEDGVVPGAGKALYDAQTFIDPEQDTEEARIAANIIKVACKEPLKKILMNADLDYEDLYPVKNSIGQGYDLVKGQYGDLMEMGIMDPAKVTKSALENAVSVATTIITTDTVVYEGE